MMDDNDRIFASIRSSLSKIFRGLGSDPNLHFASSSAPIAISSVFRDPPRKVNDAVYEIRSPVTKPSVQIIFFHGIELGDYKDAYWTDWLSRDRSQCWLETWLPQELPGARVLSVSYDSSLRQSSTFGRADLHVVSEDLVTSLIRSPDAKVGQDHCPIILVGHSLGGLVMKKFMVRAHAICSLADDGQVIEKFLSNVKGLFFYSTPHGGSNLAKTAIDTVKGALMTDVESFNIDSARLDQTFHILRSRFQWKVHGVGELHETQLDGFRGLVVEQASASHGMLGNYAAIPADHIKICKPDDKKSGSFRILLEFINGVIHEAVVPLHQCQGLPDYPVDLDGRTREIQEIMKVKQVLGIVGMGGIGKTTLAKELFNNISPDFEYTSFVDNVKGIKIHKLGDWLLSQFHRNGTRVDRPKTEWSHLRDKKVLIAMDDVDSEEQLRVLPKLHQFGSSSRVIITTRDQSVLKVYDTYACHEVDFLKQRDAKKLFCKHAFRQEEIPNSFIGRQHLIRDVTSVVRKCGGLPLTLEVIGRHLRGRENDANFWKETISRLGKAQAINGRRDDRVWAKLRVSYDALICEEKEMFASAATCFFGQPVERALAAWSTTCGTSETAWANLVTRCLVKEVRSKTSNTDTDRIGRSYEEFDGHKTVWVHEQLRDLAKHLAPSMLYASDKNGDEKLTELLNLERVDAETEFLRVGNFQKDTKRRTPQIEFGSLLNLKQLKYMELKGVLLKGSPEKFSSRTSLLCWDGALEEPKVPQFPVSCIEEMQNLTVLELKNWRTSQVFPKALGKLTNLRILRLESMKVVDQFPEDFARLSRLKRLELVKLNLSKLPESFGSLCSLENLMFDGVELTELPESFGNLFSLVTVTFLNCDKLLTLPASFCLLASLKRLEIRGAKHLEALPENLGQLTSLHELHLDGDGMKVLPESVGQLSSLHKLAFISVAEALPRSLRQLDSLTWLHIGSPNMKALPDTLVQLKSLQELEIRCPNLKKLPDNFGQLKTLMKLTIEHEMLQSLPSSFCHLVSLQKLTIRVRSRIGKSLSGVHLENLPENLGELTSLQELYLEDPSVKALPESVGQLRSLRTLEFSSSFAERLPEDLWQLTALERLRLDVTRVKALSEGVGQLSSLRQLFFCSDEVKRLPQSLGELDSLQTLWLGCRSLETLPDTLGHLESLQNLYIRWCPNLEKLPDSFGQLHSLRCLDISGSPKVKSLHSSFRLPRSLEELTISPCQRSLSTRHFKTLEIMGQLTTLRKLHLKDKRVKPLPECVGQLRSLRTLKFSSCFAKSLPDTLWQLSTLEESSLDVTRAKVPSRSA